MASTPIFQGDSGLARATVVMTSFLQHAQGAPLHRLPEKSLHQLPSAVLIAALRDLEDHVPPVAGEFSGEQALAEHAADLFHRALRAPVGLADPEDHGVDEGEGVVEHQPLDLAVDGPAPMAAGDKGPADLDLADVGLVAVVAAGADQAVARAVDEHEGHLRMDTAVEELAKLRLRVTV